MNYFRQKNTRHFLKQIAKRDGITPNEVLEELKLNIEDMKHTDEPEEHALYK